MRRMNRATRKLERLVAKYPELKKEKTILTPISIRVPESRGTIVQPLMVPIVEEKIIPLPGEPIPLNLNNWTQNFEDPFIVAKISFSAGEAILDYTIKPATVDTIVETKEETIQGTQYEPMPLSWWKLFWIKSGQIFWMAVVAFVLFKIGRKAFKSYTGV